MSSVADNLRRVLDTIAEAELKSGRKPGSVSLVAVSKFNPVEAVMEAIAAGQFLFGENRVQEAVPKFQEVQKLHGNTELHIIGTLQRNKVKKALTVASCIQSVDRIELLEEIEKQAAVLNKTVPVLFEYHTGEESKSGFCDLDSLLRAVEYGEAAPHIIPKGFMTMAPFTTDQKEILASFRKLKDIRQQVQSRFSALTLDQLSMGMTNDFPLAIQEGATLVRIGTAIFGARWYT